MKDIREVIRQLNPVLHGWGGYFRTGNASGKFNQIDGYVRERLLRLLVRRGGQQRWRPGGRPFNPREWPHRRLVEEHGLYQLLGTIQYSIPEARMLREKTIGKPDAGKPHVRFERGPQETEPARHRA
jgi:RNA-directed DNA polymerase